MENLPSNNSTIKISMPDYESDSLLIALFFIQFDQLWCYIFYNFLWSLWYCASSCTYLHTNHILQVCAWHNSPWGQAALLEKSSFCLSFNVTQKLPPPALSATWWLIFVSLCLHFFYVHHKKEGCRHFSNFRYWYFCLIRRVPLGLLYLEADG